MSTIQVRKASAEDAAAIRQIYEPYVLNTAITYETAVPSVEEFQGRIARTLSRYPYIVAEIDRQIVGYAYAGPFHARPAYDWSAELSIYVGRDFRHQGIGKILYGTLEKLLGKMGVTNLYACIASPDTPDEYLDSNSIDFHGHLGFSTVGIFHHCASKFGRWYNMAYMEKCIGEHSTPPKEVIFSDRKQTPLSAQYP